MKESSDVMPLVSIITPTFNSSKTIDETIQSIQAQTFDDWELIVTDDKSSDNTVEIVRRYAEKDARIKLHLMDSNGGPGLARNNSIRHAAGRYIAFCDSDDLWLPGKLDLQVAFMRENNLPFTYSSYRKINETGAMNGIIHAPHAITYNDLLKTCPIGCLTVIYDSQILGKTYMPAIRKRQDYGLWLIILKKIGGARGLRDVLALYRERSNSVSSNKFIAAKYHYKVLREVAHIPLLTACYYFMCYACSGVRKYIK